MVLLYMALLWAILTPQTTINIGSACMWHVVASNNCESQRLSFQV